MKLGRAVGAGATLALVLAALNRHEPPEFENLRPIDVPIWLGLPHRLRARRSPFMMRPRPLGVWAVYGAAVATLSR